MLLQYYTRPGFFRFYSRDPLGISHLSSTNFNNIIAPYFFISSQIGTAHNGRNTFIISRLILVAMTVQNGLRSEEHTSELQSRFDLVCRLLLEKKNKKIIET